MKAFVIIAIWLLSIIGYVMDVVKLIRSDFKAPYKREVLYGIGAVTGLGAIIGWFDISDK